MDTKATKRCIHGLFRRFGLLHTDNKIGVSYTDRILIFHSAPFQKSWASDSESPVSTPGRSV